MVKVSFWLLFALLAGPALAQNVIVNEFMAKNGTAFVDQDGDSSDWIELYNASAAAVNLAGWSLTDDATDLTKWVFPAEVIPASGYLVVFASSKDRAVAGAELHTNFKLSGSGEYLSLRRADGSVATEFAPAYPAQFDDVSYGLQSQITGGSTLVAASAPATALVPVDGSLGLNWTTLGFNDAAWTNGVTGIGYERGNGYDPLIGIDLETQMYTINPGAYMRVPFTVTNLVDILSLTLRMKYDDGFVAYINGTQVASSRAPASPVWNSASSSENPDASAQVFEDFTLTAPVGSLLNSGANVLALHGLNRNTTSSDFVCLPELVAQTGSNTTTVLFLDTPTPGSPNSSGALGYVGDTSFTIDRGFYTAPFATDISCVTPGSTIIYTTDGSVPSLTNGTAVAAPNAASPPLATVNISSTTVLRAAAFLPGFGPSNVDTMTYIFTADVIQQTDTVTLAKGFPASWDGQAPDYGMDPDVIGPGDLFTNKYGATIKNDLLSIPTISMVMPLDDLFGTAGIYSHPNSSGPNWERACSVEYIDPNSSEEFHINCGVRIQGGAFRNFSLTDKKSFRLLFKSQYGEGKLRFPLFDHYDGGASPDAVDEFDSLVLRMESNDGWQWAPRADPQYARDQFNRDTGLLLGQNHPHGTRTHLYINGVYWGVYNPVERPDANFAASYYNLDADSWDGINSGSSINATGDAARNTRTQNAWNTLVSLSQNVSAQAAPVDQNIAYQTVLGNFPNGSDDPATESYLDPVNYADYLIVNYWAGNNDWPRKNYYCGRENAPDSAGWRFFMWDSEWSMTMNSGVNINRLGDVRGVAAPFQELRQCEEFRVTFGDRVHRAFFNGGPLGVDSSNPDANPLAPVNNQLAVRYKALTDGLKSPLVAESARWGDQHRANDPLTVCDEWLAEQGDILSNYLPQRSDIVLNQFITAGLYSAIEAPTYNLHGGVVASGFPVSMSAPSGTVYFTTDGSDPREIGGAIAPTALVNGAPVPMTQTTVVKSRTWLGGQWSAMTEATFTVDSGCPLQISEVMYHARDAEGAEILAGFDPADYDFIEIHNPTNVAIGLVGFALTGGVQFDFSSGAINSIAAGGYVLVVADEAAFANRYGTGFPVAGTYSGVLSDNGEDLELSHTVLGCSVSAEYDDARCWPVSADGAGHSLVSLTSAGTQTANDPSNWRASAFRDGSPGQADPVAVRDVVINEFAAHTDLNDPAFPQYDSNDWIELYNAGGSAVALGPNWYLSDDVSDLRKWALPASSLAAGSWVSFDEVTGFHNPTNTGFGLSSFGEDLLLSYLPGNGSDRVADAIAFKAQDNGQTTGRLADGAIGERGLTPTRDAANEPTAQTVVINEVHYHPAPIGTNDNDIAEFIELFNPLSTPVMLSSSAGTWRLNGETDFDFAPGTTIAAGAHLLVVRFDPVTNAAARAAFEATFGLAPNSVPMVGPFSGKLSDKAGRIALERPLDPNNGWIIVDEMGYADDAPWDPTADGLGASLQRVDEFVTGKDITNWSATTPPTPGVGVPGLFNLAPVFDPLANPALITVNEGDVALFTNVATDGVGQVLTYGLSSGPAGAAVQSVSGVFTWITSELDGPSTTTVDIVVSDNGTPMGAATQPVTIVVLEVNQAPMLGAVANASVAEGQLLSVALSAADADVPANGLAFSLASGAPAGMAIDAAGNLTWTPGEGDGPGSFPVSVVVTDDGASPLAATNSFTVTVTELNQAPMLAVVANASVAEGQLLSIVLSATDADLPANGLAFSLAPGAPAGMMVDAAGNLSWTPGEGDGPGSFPVSVIVTDDGAPPLSATNSFTVTVTEVNQVPVIVPVVNMNVQAGQPVSFNINASDADLPSNGLTYSLAPGAPAGMTIDAAGNLSWTPTTMGSFPVSVVVTDDGVPPLSATNSFILQVTQLNQSPVVAPISNATVDEGQALSITVSASDPDAGNTLSFGLAPGAPAGMAIDASGNLTWTPSEADGPGSFPVSVIVTDDGAPPLAITNTFTVIVNEVNQAPVFAPVGPQNLLPGQNLTIPIFVTDVDLPAQQVILTLLNPPAGATLSGADELLFTPPAPGSYQLQVVATDDGSPAASSTQTVTVAVALDLVITDITELTTQISRIHFPAIVGEMYSLDMSPTIDAPTWTTLATIPATSTTMTMDHVHSGAGCTRFYRVRSEPPSP